MKMYLKYVISILLIKNVCCSNEPSIRKPRNSLTAARAARFNSLTGDFEEQSSPEDYFPDVEYPSDILQMAKPYFFKASCDDVLEPFPRDVKSSFKSVSTGVESNNEGLGNDKPILSVKDKKELLNNIKKQADDIVQRINSAKSQNHDQVTKLLTMEDEDKLD